MKRIIKRVFATVCVICILSAFVIPCFASSVETKITFNLCYNSTWNWTVDEQEALKSVTFGSIDLHYYPSNTLSQGETKIFYNTGDYLLEITNHSGYQITLGVGQASPWKWLYNIVLPPGSNTDPSVVYLRLSDINNYTGDIIIYADISEKPVMTIPENFTIQYCYFGIDGSSMVDSKFVKYNRSDVSGGYVSVPDLDGYTVIPNRVYVGDITSSTYMYVYAVNIGTVNQSLYDQGYQAGFDSGVIAGISSYDLTSLYNEAYSTGLQDGLNQNELTSDQIRELKSTYNVFTSFFDGIFNGIVTLYYSVASGIAFGGVTLNAVINSLIIIFFVVIFASFVLKSL